MPLCEEECKQRQLEEARFLEGVEKRQHQVEKRKLREALQQPLATEGTTATTTQLPLRDRLRHGHPTPGHVASAAGPSRPPAGTNHLAGQDLDEEEVVECGERSLDEVLEVRMQRCTLP